MSTLGPTFDAVGTSVQDASQLENIVTNSLTRGDFGWAENQGAYYRFAPPSSAPVAFPSVIPSHDSQGGLLPGRWIRIDFGGGGSAVANRRDHSVNGARVDNFRSLQPVMRTNTDANAAGSFTGGGTGNKAILGHYLPGPPYPGGSTMPLGALATVEYTYDRLTPEVTGPNIVPYTNLIVQLTPGLLVVMVLGDFGNAVPTGTFTPAALPVGPSTTQSMLWTAATDLVLVVNFEGMATPAAGPWPPIVAPSFGAAPSTPPSPGNWPGTGYKISDIVAAYPGAVILNTDPLDGGLPKLTIVSGITLNIGSSSNHTQNAVEILDWKINGVPV